MLGRRRKRMAMLVDEVDGHHARGMSPSPSRISVSLAGRNGTMEPTFEALLEFLGLEQYTASFEGIELLHMMQLGDRALCDALLKVLRPGPAEHPGPG